MRSRGVVCGEHRAHDSIVAGALREYALVYGLRRGFETDDGAVLHHGGAIVGALCDTAARGHDLPLGLAGGEQRLRFERAEVRLPMLSEDRVDGLASIHLDALVKVNEAPAEYARRLTPDGRLAGAGETCEKDVGGH